jgi:VCBS repeat-containing protein
VPTTTRSANDDVGTALEAGGVANGTPGSQATGDVLLNDTDVDAAVYGETRTVLAIRTGTEAGSGTAGSVGSALTGTYGALTLNANGTYTYVVDNANATVQQLRTPADTLSETFTYTMRDTAGATDIAQLTITIQGANDTPLAVDDSAFGWPPIVGSSGSGRHPTGNVLPNDRDVDSGDGQSVSGIRTGTELPGGDPLTAVVPGTSSGSGVRIDGTWGWLNIGADGSYLYEVDFARTASLAPGVVVQDYFTYELRDTGGLTDLAQLTVNIRGRNNPPIAVPNLPIAVEAGGIANGSPGIDPAGDITANDFDFEGDPLSVDAIRTGPESGSGTAGTIGSELAGTYGWLTQQADGTFTYRVDNANPLVEALRSSGDTLTDFFTYTVSDIYGAADQATIAVTIRGANDNPWRPTTPARPQAGAHRHPRHAPARRPIPSGAATAPPRTRPTGTLRRAPTPRHTTRDTHTHPGARRAHADHTTSQRTRHDPTHAPTHPGATTGACCSTNRCELRSTAKPGPFWRSVPAPKPAAGPPVASAAR